MKVEGQTIKIVETVKPHLKSTKKKVKLVREDEEMCFKN